MDLHTVTSYRPARSRDDLVLSAGEQVLAGGTWLFSEPQVDCTGLVDLTTLGWPDLEFPQDGYAAGGLRIGATCPILTLAGVDAPSHWRAAPLFAQCADALLQSFKVQSMATVGGNICRSFSAAAMITLGAALDGVATVWRADGSTLELPVAGIATGNGSNVLAVGDVLRWVELPLHALRARTAFRRIALAALGRSAAVLTGRTDEDGAVVMTITAATAATAVLRFPPLPDAAALRVELDAVTGWYTDPLGSADWREAVSRVLLEEIRIELRDAAG